MAYYLLEEDLRSELKLFLGPIHLDEKEWDWMIRGEDHYIPDTVMEIPVKLALADKGGDFLNQKLPLVSNRLKGILEQKATNRVYYREVILRSRYIAYLYFYLAPPLCDCFDFRNSRFVSDPRKPGGIRINGGFCLRPGPIGKLDIFRVKGLSGRKIIISRRLKEICEVNGVRGVNYIPTEHYTE